MTLYHWDLPQALEDGGGWPARDTAERFARRTRRRSGGALGDRVRRWTTVNEPWCASMLGYASGIHAPGRTEPGAAVAAAHHLLLGHGLAVDALRAEVALDAEIAITLNPYPVRGRRRPAERTPTRRGGSTASPTASGTTPCCGVATPTTCSTTSPSVTDLAHVRDGDLASDRPPDRRPRAQLLPAPPRALRRRRVGRRATAMWPGSPDVELVDPGGPVTDGGWAIEPDGLLEALLAVAGDYDPPPLYVHESGAAFDDEPDAAGEVDDQRRHRLPRGPPRAARDALDAGVDLRGFFVWSLLDNFEWAEGYTHRFGIVARRLRDPAPHAEGQRPVVRRRGSIWRRGLGRGAPAWDFGPTQSCDLRPCRGGGSPADTQCRHRLPRRTGKDKGATVKRRTLDLLFSIGGVGLAALLLIIGVVMSSNADFSNSYVTDQLVQQKITFKAAEALTDEERQAPAWSKRRPAALTGKQAECYANEFIGLHVKSSGKGKTYAEIGDDQTALRAQIAAARRSANARRPPEAADRPHRHRETVFKGETLRGVLLTSYGFSELGDQGRPGRHGHLPRRDPPDRPLRRRLRPRPGHPEVQGLRGPRGRRDGRGAAQGLTGGPLPHPAPLKPRPRRGLSAVSGKTPAPATRPRCRRRPPAATRTLRRGGRPGPPCWSGPGLRAGARRGSPCPSSITRSTTS